MGSDEDMEKVGEVCKWLGARGEYGKKGVRRVNGWERDEDMEKVGEVCKWLGARGEMKEMAGRQKEKYF